MRMGILHLILSAFAVWIVAQLVTGFTISGPMAALFAGLIIGLVNATLGFAIKLLTLPLSIVTFGFFLLVINAVMLMLSAAIVPGFDVAGFGAAFIGAIVLAVVNTLLRFVLGVKK